MKKIETAADALNFLGYEDSLEIPPKQFLEVMAQVADLLEGK